MNGILLGYSLKFQRTRTAERPADDTEERTVILNPSQLSIVLQAKTYSTYRIKVAAFTRKGMGPYSEYVYAGKYVNVEISLGCSYLRCSPASLPEEIIQMYPVRNGTGTASLVTLASTS